MTATWLEEHRTNRDLQQTDDETTCCNSEECLASYARRPEIVQMALPATAALPIQAYLIAYEAFLEQKNQTKTSNIKLNVIPSLQELQKDLRHDLKTRSRIYDCFIVPPLLLGDLLEQQGLASISFDRDGAESLAAMWNDLLPYYKTQITTLGGAIRGIPLLAGNQPLLLYRKDYLEARNMSVPVTWGDYIRVAAALHNRPLGPDETRIYGSCMGRLTEAMCRQLMDQEQGRICQSLSMSYVGMILSPMTQRSGSSSGWLFDDNTETGMQSLLNPTLETLLVFMEQQLKFGAPNELGSDSSLNLELFRDGQCGMTVTVDHPMDLLSQPNVGFAPIPGSHNVLARQGNTMMDCTPELCPFGEENDVWGTVNRVPFGTTDILVGAISAYASDTAIAALQDFFSFIVEKDLDFDHLREQPLTYSSLDASTISGYKEVMLSLTESNNTAIPLRIPDAFTLFSELDNQIYDYLVAGNYSQTRREEVRKKVETSLDRVILRHDARSTAIPMTVFYENSLNTYTPTSVPDLYIGDVTRIVGWSLGGLSCLCSIYFAFWVWRYQNEKVVRASQGMFLYMICLGTFLMAGTIFLFGVEDDIATYQAADRSCMGSMWLYSIGFVLTMTALSTKVWMINRIFRKARNMQRIKVEALDLLGPLLLIGGINLIILMTWNISDPVVWLRAPIEEPSDTLNPDAIPTYGYCNSENYRVYLGMMIGVNYVFSVVSLVQAYECRKISTDYLESLWIGASLIAIVQVWSIGLPLLKLLDNDPNGVFMVKVGVVFLTTMCTLLLIFVPKMGYLRESLLSEPDTKFDQGHDSFQAAAHKDQNSVTSHDSEGSPKKETSFLGNKVTGAFPTVGKGKGRKAPSGLEGIRIIQSSNRHSEELEKLQRSLRHAEARNKTLNERLERLQEKLEQHIVSRHPHHAMQGSANNFILSARAEQVKLSGSV